MKAERKEMRSEAAVAPWYKHRWPWILMAGPATVVVAGIVTTVLAVRTSDGLVADDYYRQGLGINKVMDRDARARSLGVAASVQFNEPATRARVILTGPAAASLKLALVHPTRAGEDQAVVLAARGNGVYEGAIAAPRSPTLLVQLEDAEGRWRLTGEWKTRQNALALMPD